MLVDDIRYWSIILKSYCATWNNSMASKEAYGIDESKLCWLNLIWATQLVEILDCYDVDDDPCLEETDIKKIFQQASYIINKRCG